MVLCWFEHPLSREWIHAVYSNIYPRGLPFLFSLEILFTVNSLVRRYRDKRELGSFPPHLPFFRLTKSVFTNISKVFGGKKWNLLRSLSGLICLFLGICKFLFDFLSEACCSASVHLYFSSCN